jgi:hypothetical protein
MNLSELSQAYALTKETGVTILDGKKAERKEMYIRKNANGYGAGVKPLITSDLNEEVGVTNFENKGMLPAGKDLLVRGLKISYAPTADATPKTAKYGNDNGLPAFTNGEIKIEQDGVLLRLPIKAVSVSSTNDNYYLEGKQYYEVVPFMIKSGKNFQISVEPVDAIAVAHCFEIALDTIELSESAKVTSASARGNL